MKTIIKILPAIIILICATIPAPAADRGIVGTIGLPAGYMDISYNAHFYVRHGLIPKLQTEWLINESFSRKGAGDGYLATNVASIFLLQRFMPELFTFGLSPFVSAGAGGHLIYSFSSNDSPAFGKHKTTFKAKGHAFLGAEYKFASKLFVTVYGRMTFPSDKIIDSGYMGLGIVF